MAKKGSKAKTLDELPPYKCWKHGEGNPRITIRKSGYIHRRCRKCFTENTKPYMRKYMSAWNKRRRLRLRAEVIAEYGAKCACCGEARETFLTIDHVNNDGAKDRKEFRSAFQIYGLLASRGFPRDGYELACFNCNLGRAKNGGICPHKLEESSGLGPGKEN